MFILENQKLTKNTMWITDSIHIGNICDCVNVCDNSTLCGLPIYHLSTNWKHIYLSVSPKYKPYTLWHSIAYSVYIFLFCIATVVCTVAMLFCYTYIFGVCVMLCCAVGLGVIEDSKCGMECGARWRWVSLANESDTQ